MCLACRNLVNDHDHVLLNVSVTYLAVAAETGYSTIILLRLATDQSMTLPL